MKESNQDMFDRVSLVLTCTDDRGTLSLASRSFYLCTYKFSLDEPITRAARGRIFKKGESLMMDGGPAAAKQNKRYDVLVQGPRVDHT